MREAAAVAIEVRDKEYRAELIREIELKEKSFIISAARNTVSKNITKAS